MTIAVTLLALLVEATVGYPDRLLPAIGHPVMWIGALIQGLDRMLNRDALSPPRRRKLGFVALAAIVAIPAGIACGIERGLLSLPFGFFLASLCASTLLAQKSLGEHVMRVAVALEREGIEGGRTAVSHIVGRDTDALDEAGI